MKLLHSQYTKSVLKIQKPQMIIFLEDKKEFSLQLSRWSENFSAFIIDINYIKQIVFIRLV